jgi:signal recognition particle subunit SRP54
VVQALVERIKVRAVGQEVLKSLTPGQALIKVVRDELTTVMGSADERPEPQRPRARP